MQELHASLRHLSALHSKRHRVLEANRQGLSGVSVHLEQGKLRQ